MPILHRLRAIRALMAYGRETFVRKCLRSQSSQRRIGALLNRRALASIFLLRRKLETDANDGLAGRQGTGRRYLTRECLSSKRRGRTWSDTFRLTLDRCGACVLVLREPDRG